jgi:hypothetical protein
MEYSGLLIGPDSPRNLRLVDWLNDSALAPMLRWLNPKLFISLRKPGLSAAQLRGVTQ